MKIQRSFHKTDPIGTLNGLQFIKPRKIKITGANTRLHARLQALEIAASSFKPMQICSKFQKPDNTRRSTGPRSTKPKNFRPKRWATRLQKLRHSHRQIHAPTLATFTRLQAPRAYTRTLALCTWRHPPLPRFDPDRPGNLTRSEPPTKKKKSFDQVELWLWPKSQNFQKWPVPFSFLSTFRFWDPFLHLKLGNCANGPIPKKLTFAQILTKKSKFSRSTCLAQFFA